MDKNTTENKLARNVETKRKIDAASCPEKGEHRSYLGRTHPACGEEIPFGPFDGMSYARFIEVRPQSSAGSSTSPEVAAIWAEYADADAERARLAGEIAKADSDLVALRTEADNARYGRSSDSDDDAQAKIERLREHRAELIEARDAAVERSRALLSKRSKVEAREAAEQRRLEVSRPGLVERVQRAFR